MDEGYTTKEIRRPFARCVHEDFLRSRLSLPPYPVAAGIKPSVDTNSLVVAMPFRLFMCMAAFVVGSVYVLMLGRNQREDRLMFVTGDSSDRELLSGDV